MPKLKPTLRAKAAEPSDAGPCPRCAAPIRVGDTLRQITIPGSRRRPYAHIDCRGRLEHHLGLNDAAYKPAPREFHAPPRCPVCGAYMNKSAEPGSWWCALSDRHPSGEPVAIHPEEVPQ